MLQTVADGLKELKDEMVFIGGSIAELYANDPAASDIRPTLDVDCVNELSSRIEKDKLDENLCALQNGSDSDRVEIIEEIIRTIAEVELLKI